MSLENRLVDLAAAVGQDMRLLIQAMNDIAIGPPLSVVRSDEDSGGIFTTISHYRANNSLYRTSTLSGGSSPNYTQRTVTYYFDDGVTVRSTQVYVLNYNAYGALTSEMLQP